jgi:imidazolonepropionase-like amidohydrolase
MMMKRFSAWTMRNAFRVLVLSALIPGATMAQQGRPPAEEKELAPVSRTYAITNVTIIQAPGRKVEGGTLVIKDGLIQAAGKGIAVPAGAVVIKGDSMFVYAGFIDGLSRTGVSKPKEEGNRERLANPGNPPPERAGITPQQDVRNHLIATDKAIEEMRSVGFTTAQVVPFGVLLPGAAAVIQLSGKPADQVVLVTRSSLYSELTSNQGVYPGTILGIMAKWRDLYRQAALSHTYEGLYAANRTGLERPATDRVLEAFYPVIDKKVPVLFKAEKILDVQRVLQLQSDLGFSVVVSDVKEGWDAIAKLKAANARVLLSLDLPEEVKKDDKKGDQPAGQAGKKSPEGMTAAEKAALEGRKEEFTKKYESQAAVFQQAGIRFGFSALDVKPANIATNLRRMVKAGLSEDAALAALTVNPAEILGMSDRLGTIDNGKIANLVISDKPYFNEKAKVKYVFIDGQPFKMTPAEKKGDANAKVDVTGSWSVTADTPNGKNQSTVTFTKDGNNYSGKVSGGMMPNPVDLTSVEVDGTNLKYKYVFTMGGNQNIDVEVDVTVDGDTFKGSVSAGSFGSFPVEGKKDPK